jgi:molybdenum cofactor cytidylyltransferase
MGQPKQLMAWGATTLLGNAIDAASQSNADSVFVVLGAKAESIQTALKGLRFKTIVNREWENGMGSSISTGIRHIMDWGHPPDAILLMVGDQPFMDAVYLNKLIDTYHTGRAKIVATQYPSKLGVPAIFDSAYYDALGALKGEQGAGLLIKKHQNDCVGLNAGKKVLDLDTVDEYRKYKPENH